MKQLLQDLKTGNTEVTDVPMPQIKDRHLLLKTTLSLISTGTERMLVDFGKASYIQKARQQPEKVRQVLDKIKTNGLLSTINAVQSKLDQPLALGYCNVGRIVETHLSPLPGRDSHPTLDMRLKRGDRVASNDPHAEVVCVPNNLCAKIPDVVTDEEAAFTVIAGIGLQGARPEKQKNQR